MHDETTPLTIDVRFSGPPGSANGGYVSGRLAALLPAVPVVEVTLRQPPPLQTRLDATATDDMATLTFGGSLIAEAVPAGLTHDVVDQVDFETAAAAMARYDGLQQHPFPGCFACGVDRPSPDGLGLRPGRLADRPDCVATTWLPDASLATADGTVRAEMVWAALDCPGGWSADLVGRPMVLGRMAAAVDALPHVGERYVVVGRCLGVDGRKTFTASTIYDADGRVLGRAEATWIALRP
ncbi:MAG: hypothetical protein ACXV2G_00015 [Actinomycetes bacterium]